jgi:hypothetical protein
LLILRKSYLNTLIRPVKKGRNAKGGRKKMKERRKKERTRKIVPVLN